MSRKIVIMHYAGPPVIGGVETTIYHHARLLSDLGYQVEVIAGRGKRFHPKVPFHAIEEIDSRYEGAAAIGKSLAAGKVPSEFLQLRQVIMGKLLPLVEGAHACIVHNALSLHKNLPFTAALKELAAQKMTPFIAWCHDFAWQDELYTPDLHPGYPWELLRNPWPGVQYVVVSEHRRHKLSVLLGLPETEIKVVTPGIDIYKFLKLENLTQVLLSKLNILEANPILLLPARITRRKNIEYAIRVVGFLKNTFPKVVLIITGPPGPHNPKNVAYLESLQELSDYLGVVENVVFLYQQKKGNQQLLVPYEVVGDLYHLADILLFPSLREGFGIPVLESGLAKLPVFAFNIPPIQESARDLGHLFDPGSEPSLVARAIVNFLEKDHAYRLRRRIIDYYSWDRIVQDQVVPILEQNK